MIAGHITTLIEDPFASNWTKECVACVCRCLLVQEENSKFHRTWENVEQAGWWYEALNREVIYTCNRRYFHIQLKLKWVLENNSPLSFPFSFPLRIVFLRPNGGVSTRRRRRRSDEPTRLTFWSQDGLGWQAPENIQASCPRCLRFQYRKVSAELAWRRRGAKYQAGLSLKSQRGNENMMVQAPEWNWRIRKKG